MLRLSHWPLTGSPTAEPYSVTRIAPILTHQDAAFFSPKSFDVIEDLLRKTPWNLLFCIPWAQGSYTTRGLTKLKCLTKIRQHADANPVFELGFTEDFTEVRSQRRMRGWLCVSNVVNSAYVLYFTYWFIMYFLIQCKYPNVLIETKPQRTW